MMKRRGKMMLKAIISAAVGVILSATVANAENAPLKVTIQWEKVTAASKLHGAVQLGPEHKNEPLHDKIIQDLHDLQADIVRYIPWYPDPPSAVAELYPPANGKTSWDFSAIDPPLEEFLKAMDGHSFIMNFSTIPEWMFKTEKPVDPLKAAWGYEQGTELSAGLQDLGDYCARLVSWYTQGGFKDEYGKWHESGHHFTFPYWEVMNEPELEHATTPEQYTERYDAIVGAIHKVSPQTKFIGLALGLPMWEPKYFTYFLNPRNHRPGIPIDFVSYHFYATYRTDFGRKEQIATVFDQADHLLDTIRYIEAIRDQFAETTGMVIDEMGTGPVGWAVPDSSADYLAFEYQLSAAMYAYLYGQMAALGVDAANVSGLVRSRPGSIFQELAMVDSETGQPNNRYWGLKLLLSNLCPGDKLVATSIASQNPFGGHEPRELPVYMQGFVTESGVRKLLLVNKCEGPSEVLVPGAQNARMEVVDQTTGNRSVSSVQLSSDTITLRGLAVAVVTFP
jgi:hypothetical protein